MRSSVESDVLQSCESLKLRVECCILYVGRVDVETRICDAFLQPMNILRVTNTPN